MLSGVESAKHRINYSGGFYEKDFSNFICRNDCVGFTLLLWQIKASSHI
jgi:hypothetical protein